MSILYSNLLLREGIAQPLEYYNAPLGGPKLFQNLAKLGVTVATSMASRGDIKLGPG